MNEVQKRIWMIEFIEMLNHEKKKSFQLDVHDESKFLGKKQVGGKNNEREDN